MSDTFTYNGLGLRVGKTDSTGTRGYVCDGTEAASAVLSDGAAVYTPGLSERRGGASHFTHADALGSTRGLTDGSQSATDALLFDGFGLPVARSGSTPTPFGFVGGSEYQTDGDTGLLLLGHRYYDASVGRFLTADPAQAGGNWYAYCGNNPLNGTDPSGYMLAAGAIFAGGLRLAAGAEILGGGPADPAGDAVALTILAGTALLASGVYLATIYRQGGTNPGSWKESDGGRSCRDTLSNPWPQPSTGPVFKHGDDWVSLDTDKLPPGSVDYDNNPPGHVSVDNDVPIGSAGEDGTIKGARNGGGKFPK